MAGTNKSADDPKCEFLENYSHDKLKNHHKVQLSNAPRLVTEEIGCGAQVGLNKFNYPAK